MVGATDLVGSARPRFECVADALMSVAVYVVCYDVSEDRKRDRIAQILLGYGQRVQHSVFEIALRSPSQLAELCEQLRVLTDEQTKIRLYRLCAHCRQDSQNEWGEKIVNLPAVVIV